MPILKIAQIATLLSGFLSSEGLVSTLLQKITTVNCAESAVNELGPGSPCIFQVNLCFLFSFK